ncbi:MAG: endonuclease MutS2 [Chloroflexota bacterium]|nr:endonuclease MutS2 [Chloroflexota bacterium]
MDTKSLELLEFPQIREMLAGFASFSASRELALNLQPLTDRESIVRLLQQSAEAQHLLAVEPNFSIGGVHDVRETVKMAARGKVLEPLTLLDVQQTLTAFRLLRASLDKLGAELPLLWDIVKNVTELPQLENDIAACLTPSGEVMDSASTKLAGVRRQLRDTHQQLLDRLQTTMTSPRGRKIIQEPIITEREGRYVIPVKLEFRREIKGIVHDVSNTGQTIFVEPLATVDLGNTLRELTIEEKREIDRILGKLSAEIGAYEAEIAESVARLAALDLALAKARYARKAKASEPVITNSTEKVLKLADARHPLLGEKAIPLSVEMGRDYSILVITGPNTGGKTVALKTIGLLSLMAQSGLPIPAAPESCVPVFDGIFADIGDEQSIEQRLSTFSWHVGNIVRIINQASGHSLVLLDELGTNTDPVEGSALARSILQYFLERGALTVITSHFSELKAFAHTTPGLQNASLDFDPVTLAPTYHLTVGIPGGSNALATAARLGLAAEIIARAREILPQGSQKLESLLANLMAEKQTVASLRRDLKREKDETHKRNSELEKELQRLSDEERQVIKETRDRLVQEVAELHREIRQAAAELRKEKSRETVDKAKQAVAAMRERLAGEAWQAKSDNKAVEVPDDNRVKVGDTVRVKDADLRATVLSILEDSGQVEVQAGNARLTLDLSGVEKMAAAQATTPSFTLVKKPAARSVPAELDLRGKRAHEVEPLLDAYLNDASLANLSEVRIIHGMATGTVRDIVRDLLASHPLVKSSRPGERNEGASGVTIARL